jgi:hypothetical protein
MANRSKSTRSPGFTSLRLPRPRDRMPTFWTTLPRHSKRQA